MNYFDEVKSRLTIEDVFNVLEHFSGCPFYKGQNIIISRTICHGGDSHKLYYYNNTKLFRCYTDCGEEPFDIYELINKIYTQVGKTLNNYTIVEIIEGILGKNLKNKFTIKKSDNKLWLEKKERILEIQNQKNEKYQFPSYQEQILSYLDRVTVTDWVDEGISPEVQWKYGIRYYPIANQIIIPHYSIEGKLIGIRGRFIDDKDCELYGKYRPAFINGSLYSHPLSYTLYGINFSHLGIFQCKKAIIFESEKSVMKYESYFGAENNIAVACCGSSVSKQQIDILLRLGVNEIVLALDRQYKEINDKENIKYLKNIFAISKKIMPFCNVSVIYDSEHSLKYKDAPIDEGKDIFIELFNKRIFVSKKDLTFIS